MSDIFERIAARNHCLWTALRGELPESVRARALEAALGADPEAAVNLVACDRYIAALRRGAYEDPQP